MIKNKKSKFKIEYDDHQVTSPLLSSYVFNLYVFCANSGPFFVDLIQGVVEELYTPLHVNSRL